MGSSHIHTNVRHERISDLTTGLNPFVDGPADSMRTPAVKEQRTQHQPTRRTPPPIPKDARR